MFEVEYRVRIWPDEPTELSWLDYGIWATPGLDPGEWIIEFYSYTDKYQNDMQILIYDPDCSPRVFWQTPDESLIPKDIMSAIVEEFLTLGEPVINLH